MLQTLNPTTCSTEYSNVDFIKGGWGNRSRLADSPREAVLQVDTLDISRHFFPPGRWEVFLLDFITLGTDGWVGFRTTFGLEFILSYLA